MLYGWKNRRWPLRQTRKWRRTKNLPPSRANPRWHKCFSKDAEQILHTMNNLLYAIAVILVIVWAIGFFAYSTGGIIHILLVIAVIAILLRLIRGSGPV